MVKITAAEARRMYQREWRAKNPDKVKAIAERYWAKKAAELNAAMASKETEPDDAK